MCNCVFLADNQRFEGPERDPGSSSTNTSGLPACAPSQMARQAKCGDNGATVLLLRQSAQPYDRSLEPCYETSNHDYA